MSQDFFVFLHDGVNGQIYQPERAAQVLALSWCALGGCKHAKFSVPAYPGSLMFWQSLLGKPVQIYNKFGNLVWWGYVHALAQPVGSLRQICSLVGMANRVAVAYTALEPNASSYGEALQTEWTEDSESIALYGQKDLLLVKGMMAESAAIQLRDEALRQRAKPKIQLQPNSAAPSDEKPDMTLQIDCRGWAEQLSWRVYQPPAGVIGNTAAQQGTQAVGNTTSASKVAQSFVFDGESFAPSLLQVRIRRQGSPNDWLRVSIQSDANGVPSGVEVANGQVSGTELDSEAYPWVKFVFSLAPQLTPGKTYWIVFSRTGTITASAYYVLAIDEKLSFPAGVLKINNGSAWLTRNPIADLVFKLTSAVQTSALLEEVQSVFKRGPFSQVSVQFESGIYTTPLGSRPKPVEQLVKEILALGTSTGEEIIYSVTPQRGLIFRLKPTPVESPPFWLTDQGEVRDPGGERLLPGQLPVGTWVETSHRGTMFITAGEIRAPDWLPKLES
jgi:hypothetical protein